MVLGTSHDNILYHDLFHASGDDSYLQFCQLAAACQVRALRFASGGQTLADIGRHLLKLIRSKFVTCQDQSLKIPQILQSLRICRDIRHYSRDLQGVFFQMRLAFARMSLCLQMCAQRYGTIPIVTLCGGLKDSPKARLVRLEMLSSSFSKYSKLHGIKTYQDSVATLCRTQ